MTTVIVEETIIIAEDQTNPISIIEVGTQGPSGPAGPGALIIETGSYASPQLITSSIAIPLDARARIYIKGSSGPVVDPSLGNGSGTQELYLFGTSDTNTVQLDSASNLKLDGEIVLRDKTQLCLHWIQGLNKWVEAGRNEI